MVPDQGASNSYLANELNQYDDVDSVPFTYDGNGNLTGDGVDTYDYDVESRLLRLNATVIDASVLTGPGVGPPSSTSYFRL